MEGRILSLLLSAITGAMILFSHSAWSEELNENQELVPVIQPEIKRNTFEESKIASGDFEVMAFAGLLSIEDFGVNEVVGARLAYHVSEDFFVNATLGMSEAGKTSYEILNAASLIPAGERELTYYLINLGYNFLPGEAFITDQTTYNTALYLIAGIGNTDFAGNSHFTMSFGAGYRFLVANFMSVYLDVRDHSFDIDILGESKLTHNLEVSMGLSYYF